MFKKSIIILIFILGLGLSNTLYGEYDVNNTSGITNCKDKMNSDECNKAKIQQNKDFKGTIDFLTKQKEEELNKKIKDVQKEINDVQKNTDIAKIEAAQAVVDNPVSTYKAKNIASKALVRDAQIAYNECKNKGGDCANQEKKLNDIKKVAETAKNNYLTKSKEAKNDITTSVFTINVGDISPGMNTHGGNLEENVNFVLGTIIQKLMIGLGSLSILIMTVGAGYIVLHNGQDELLNKGKSIFMSGIYAMIVALSSYYLITIVRYLLYH